MCNKSVNRTFIRCMVNQSTLFITATLMMWLRRLVTQKLQILRLPVITNFHSYVKGIIKLFCDTTFKDLLHLKTVFNWHFVHYHLHRLAYRCYNSLYCTGREERDAAYQHVA